MWRAVYAFRPGGLGLFSRKDEFCHGRFKGPVNPKDGYAVEDCIDDRHRRLLQFLIPILHPEKPTRLTITLGNQIFGAIVANRKIDWSRVMGDLVSGLVSRIGKSRATPLSAYLFHLYQEQSLLLAVEEKVWRDQEVLLKYGDSGTDDEAEDPSGTESEEEEEEKLKRPPKRQKTTSPHGRGTPPVGPQTEGRPDKQPEVISVREELDSADPFTGLITILSDIRADWEVKKRTLVAIGTLVGADPDESLTGRVAECITNPDEIRRLEEEVRRQQEEVDRLKAEVLTFKDDMAVAKEMAEDTRKVAEQVKATFGETGMVAAKAKLFDEGVLQDKKLSGSRIVRILGDFAEQVEALMVVAREAADRMEGSSQRLTGSVFSRDIRLSDLSLPEISLQGGGKKPGNNTPQSKKSQHRPGGAERIDLESSPEGTNTAEGERNRNLSDVFEQMGVETAGPSEPPTKTME
jgi:hypothetical protein